MGLGVRRAQEVDVAPVAGPQVEDRSTRSGSAWRSIASGVCRWGISRERYSATRLGLDDSFVALRPWSQQAAVDRDHRCR